MATIKTTDLSSLAVPAQGDVLLLSDISASTSYKITTQALVAQGYGDLTLTAATANQTLSSSFAKLTVFDGTTASYNCTIAGDNDSITVANAGIYMIMFSCNFSSDAAKTIAFALSVGGTEDEDDQSMQVAPTSGAANIYNASFCVLKSLSAGNVLTVEAKANSGTPELTFNNINLVVKKIDASA
tara:strand:+ start:1063 stop:1617 length:555 start_codon:yes stop_codon:yes gene_type:complete